jgi:hypothetical protein
MSFTKLDNGQWLYLDYGKYRPNLTFVLDEIPIDTEMNESIDFLPWKEIHMNYYNIDGRVIDVLPGNFWVSKKGTSCFHPTMEGAKHHLLRERWGERRDRGDLSEEEGALYFRRASSNGGGRGFTYMVVNRDWRKSISIDDI